MIHYHGTPVGGASTEAAKFLMGRHALVPFSYPRDLAIALDVCQSVCLDNGAFTHWKKGHGEVDIEDYRQWVSSVVGHPSLDWCLIPDSIDGGQEKNVEMVNTWLRAGCSVEGVPVFHMDEELDWLDWLVKNFRTVALGSSGQWATPGTDAWWGRMGEMMRVACDDQGRPRARLHGLRMLDPDIFTRLPLASADSTNAAVNSGSLGRFGSYLPPTASQRAEVIAARIEIHNSAPVWTCGGAQGRLIA